MSSRSINNRHSEAELLIKMLNSPSSRSASPTKREKAKPRSASPTKRTASPTKAKRADKNNTHLENVIDVLEFERDQYKNELDKLRSVSPVRSRSPPVRDRSPSPLKFRCNSATESCRSSLNGFGKSTMRDVNYDSEGGELQRLKRERDELQTLLSKFERHLGEIQGNVRVLTQERDAVTNLYEETKTELNKMRQEVLGHARASPKVSLAAQAVLRRVESERDDSLADLRRMTTERDSLRERIKVATNAALNDKARLEQRCDDLVNISKRTVTERDEQIRRLNLTRQRVVELEEQLKSQSSQLIEKADQLAEDRNAYDQQKIKLESTVARLNDYEKRTVQLEGELNGSEERLFITQDRLHQTEKELKNLRDVSAQQRQTVEKMEFERERMVTELEERDTRGRNTEAELTACEKALSEVTTRANNLDQQVQRLGAQLSGREQDLAQGKKQAEVLHSELDGERRRLESMIKEKNRLQDDLATSMRENQTLSNDLRDVADEREHFRERSNDYANEIKRLEDTLEEKINDQNELIEQYKMLNRESDQVRTQSVQLEAELSNTRLELQSRDTEIARQREKLNQNELDIQDQRHSINSYEIQLSNLTRSLNDVEESLRQTQQEKDAILRDLAAMRELCAKLESSKDALQRQLTGKALDAEQLRAQTEDIGHECAVLRDQLAAEQDSVSNMESMLGLAREKEFASQLEAQERGAEISALKDRMDIQEAKAEQQVREITRLRTKNSEMDTDIERLHRQVNAEKFEKERAQQEIRRHGLLSNSGVSGGYRSTSSMGFMQGSHTPLTSSRQDLKLSDTLKKDESVA